MNKYLKRVLIAGMMCGVLASFSGNAVAHDIQDSKNEKYSFVIVKKSINNSYINVLSVRDSPAYSFNDCNAIREKVFNNANENVLYNTKDAYIFEEVYPCEMMN